MPLAMNITALVAIIMMKYDINNDTCKKKKCDLNTRATHPQQYSSIDCDAANMKYYNMQGNY